ncbi:MAG: ribose-phosphate diphosphokinase [Bacillota bacterium]
MARFDSGRLQLFAGNANRSLAQDIASNLGIQLGDMEVGRFSNGEIKVVINENVRGSDTFLIQPTCQPVNDNLMEALIIIDALRRASAKRITAVVPYYGYGRQDRKTRGREPISAKLVANLFTVAGVDRMLTVDLHAGQIQGFFDIPLDNLSGIPILADYLVRKGITGPDVIVVSPDLGGAARARDMAHRLNCSVALVDKRRPEPNVAEVMNIIGKVDGKVAVLVDDMIDTAGTICEATNALLERGAVEVYACGTHPVFSGPALERIEKSALREVVVTDTIPVDQSKVGSKVKVLSLAPLLAEAIIRIHEDLSVSKLFT